MAAPVLVGNWWWHHLSRSSRRARSPLPPLAERFLGLTEVLGGGGGGGIPPRVGDGQKAGGGGRCGGCWSGCGCPETKGAACRDGALDCSGWGEIPPPSADVGMSCVVPSGGGSFVVLVFVQTAGAAVAGEEVRCRSGGGRFDDSPGAAAAAALSFHRRCGSIAADSTTHSLTCWRPTNSVELLVEEGGSIRQWARRVLASSSMTQRRKSLVPPIPKRLSPLKNLAFGP